MARWYTRAEQRKYRDERRAQAKLVADRLMGKKKIYPDAGDYFDGTQMYQPIQYAGISRNTTAANRMTNFIISGMEGV